jgi:DNA mismatch repair protein MutL
MGALFDTYLLFRDTEGLIIIDFHAAHERFIYDRLMDADADIETQQLIFPHTPELTPQECAAVLDNLERFSAAGFDVEQIGESDLAVRGVPAAAPGLNVDAFFHDLLDSLERETDSAGWRERIAEKAACHSARRSGDELSPSEALSLARQALSGKHDLRCPHGRPYLYRLERGDIERLFKRK